MEHNVSTIITVLCTVIASSGFWAYINRRCDGNDARTQMLIGLGHDRIMSLALHYIERGWITNDEYENLHKYLFVPYRKIGGNGSAERIMREVDKLEIRKASYNNKKEENNDDDE